MDTSNIDIIPDLLIPRQFVNNESKKIKRRKRIVTRTKNEDPEARIVRLEKNRLYQALVRLNETPEKREARLERERQRRRLMRQCKKGPKYKQLLERQREYTAKGRLNETPEKREARRERERRNAIKRRLNEDPEKRRIRVERHRIYVAEKRQNETPEEREIRLKHARDWKYRQKHYIDYNPDCTTKTGQNVDLDAEKAPSEHESKPSHEHLNEIKHKKKFPVNNLHTNIKAEYSDYDIIDNIKEECTEVIIPDDRTDSRVAIEELSSIKVEHTTLKKEDIYSTDT